MGCEPPSATAWINDRGPLVNAPKALMLGCADANYGLMRIRWQHWGTSRASATVTVDRLTRCGSAHYHARLTIAYANAQPTGC